MPQVVHRSASRCVGQCFDSPLFILSPAVSLDWWSPRPFSKGELKISDSSLSLVIPLGISGLFSRWVLEKVIQQSNEFICIKVRVKHFFQNSSPPYFRFLLFCRRDSRSCIEAIVQHTLIFS